MAHIIITGSSKGIGAYLFDKLKKKHNVIGISRSKGKRTTHQVDITDKVKLKKIICQKLKFGMMKLLFRLQDLIL